MIVSSGMDRIWSVPSFSKFAGMSPATMRSLPIWWVSTPRKMYIVPRVTTRAGTRKKATRKPLIAPSAAPTSIPARKTSTTIVSGLAMKILPVT